MELIYRTFDGKEFDNEADAAYHENTVLNCARWWNRNGKEYTLKDGKTSSGFVVYLPNELATEAFLKLAAEQEDLEAKTIEADSYGIFVWDEVQEQYMLIDDESFNIIKLAFDFKARMED